ncbi:hypothetical protein [Ursidibacter arcticus]|uniref:hypothetical protein n=1 Tax=Ursidibacter arcticus TaxID=1524965 RepID=UPI0012FCB974|nr:hypothetical protein [Ursidibacter arcticus]KAE9535485.1 hypothetical protein A1D25_04380 [Ursidibacter arcticus]
MIDKYTLERKEHIKDIWREKLYPQLSQLDFLDKDLLIKVRLKFLNDLPDEFEKLQHIYSLMNDIQAILNGRADLAEQPTIEANLYAILAIQ